MQEENKKLAQQIKVENRVHFLGFRNDVERILKTVDIVVLSSNWEGFGLAAAEGMAAGKPVIASSVPGLAEIVKDAGILFPKGDYHVLAKYIKKIIFSKSQYNSISRCCYNKSVLFNITRMVNQYTDIYKELKRD